MVVIIIVVSVSLYLIGCSAAYLLSALPGIRKRLEKTLPPLELFVGLWPFILLCSGVYYSCIRPLSKLRKRIIDHHARIEQQRLEDRRAREAHADRYM